VISFSVFCGKKKYASCASRRSKWQWQSNKETCMAACYLYIRTMHTFIRTIICEPSNCGKTKLISLLENPYENISCTRNRCKQPKYQYLTNLVLIEKIGYLFRLYFLIITASFHWARRFRVPSLSLMTLHAASRTRIKEYFTMGRYTDINCFYLCHMYAKTKHLTRQCKSVDSIQIVWYQSETYIQRSYEYGLWGFLRFML